MGEDPACAWFRALECPLLVSAPCVGVSDAPWRALLLSHGASAVWTEMIFADRVVSDASYLNGALPLHDVRAFSDRDRVATNRPLVVQLAGNDPGVLAQAVRVIMQHERQEHVPVSAIELNLGCPQDRAKEGNYGSFLLDHKKWPLVFACIKSMVEAMDSCNDSIRDDSREKGHIFAKIRICEEQGGGAAATTIAAKGEEKKEDASSSILDDAKTSATLAFCRGLVASGASLITIHGRTRGSTKLRRCGPADLRLIAAVAAVLNQNEPSVPVIANGNISCRQDVARALAASSPCIGVMSGEGLLADPAIFSTTATTATSAASIDRHGLFVEYCELSRLYEASGGWQAVDSLHHSSCFPSAASASSSSSSTSSTSESKQISVARAHLSWMLEKQGHGRTVRYAHTNFTHYKKHCHVLKALNEATSLDDLLQISSKCLVGVYGSSGFTQREEDEAAGRV